jgi:Caspase domain
MSDAPGHTNDEPDSATARERAKRALLIGIDAYRYPEFIRSLNGCVNDVELMHSVLRDHFGFPAETMKVLRNEEASRDSILAALDQLVKETGTDDIVVIHYAGHGSQMTDREGDEPSGYDSTIMPWDTQGWRGENRDITDDEIHLRLQDLGAKTRYITLLFDCCHSGTITRDDFGVEARFMPRDERAPDELPPSPIPPDRRPGMVESGPSGWVPLTDRYVLIAGCRDSEVSFEYRPPESDGQVTHGALTYFLAQELRKAALTEESVRQTSYRDVFERAAALVNGANSKQHPQMEGRADREIFGVGDLEPMPFVLLIDPTGGGNATLAAGAAFGVTAGSVYAIYPQGTKRPDGDPIAQVEVTEVRAISASATVRPGAKEPLTAGMRAIETKHEYGDLQLGVQLVTPEALEAESRAMADAIEASSLLKRVEDTRRAAVRVYLLEPRSEAKQGDPVPQMPRVDAPTWVVVNEAGQIAMPPKPADGVADVIANLEKLSRYRQALALDNTNPASELRGQLELVLLRKNASDEWVEAEADSATGETVFEVGESIAFRLMNRLSKTPFVTLLNFTMDGEISVLYPEQRAAVEIRPLVASGAGFFDVGLDGDFFMESLPDTFPYNAPPEEGGLDSGVETVKLVVTSDEANFSFLEQGAFRDDMSPLMMLWASATIPETRGIARRTKPAPQEDWTTVVKSYVLRRPQKDALRPDGEPLRLGGTTLTTTDLEGSVAVHPWGSDRATAGELASDDLTSALDDAGIEIRQTVEISGTRVRPTRSADGTPALELSVRDPGPGYGQMVLGTDESGALSWHFAPVAEPDAAATRGGGGGSVRRYHIPSPAVSAPATGPAQRGLVGAVGRKFLKELVFPLVDPVIGAVGNAFAGAWEKRHRPYRLRSFTPDDFASADAPVMDEAGWKRLASGRSLLLVHGTFSRANSAFGGMSRAFVESLHRRYEGRVFAFDHFTLSHDPTKNIDMLIAAIPSDLGLDCDIICHSRGGLVARVLTEKQGELSLGSRSIRIGKVVFAGAPNAGTLLAGGDRLGDLIDTFTNLANFVPDVGVTDTIAAIIAVAKQLAVGAVDGLPGLQSMVPDGKFFKKLNTGDRIGDTRYFALSSDYTPSEPGLIDFAKNRLMDAIFKGDGNDLVVPTDSVFDANGSGFFPIEDRFVLTDSHSVGHTQYFTTPAVLDRIEEWLSA